MAKRTEAEKHHLTYAKKFNSDTCLCYIDCKPFSWIPVLDVKNPYCMKCGKSIL